jgi:hypothetical protein
MKALRTAPACLLVAILACSDQTPTDPNSVAPDELGVDAAVIFHERDVQSTFETAWCGETQLWEYTQHIIEQETETPSGRMLWAFRTNFYGTVVGVPSGNVYKLRGHFEVREILDDDGYPYIFMRPGNNALIGQGGVPNIHQHVKFVITKNANGDVTVDRLVIDVKCQ